MELTRVYSGASLRRAYLGLFVLSGFSGLIYQSIWTHYLKLFLGHAAYAQTLVLTIFMGGMAIGAWGASRLGVRWSRPLLAYAATEALVGVLALVFHPVFVALTGWSYDSVIPALGSPLLVEWWKWGLAGLLILPQSVLLGATFPFMSSGLLRRVPENPGRMIAGLYFANSLGAAVGILVAGFVLIGAVGLPGTVTTAGFINLALALVVYVLVRSDRQVPAPAIIATAATETGKLAPVRVLMAVSLLTGLASFFYEIGWIRMLSMVLGSSTHAFELMLSAFITGIAIGGFWVRRHIDGFAHPLRALAVIQLAMGVLAIATLMAYGQTFHAMEFILQALKANDPGYVMFNVLSHGLVLLVMLPATICAGMTLPIITHVLVTRGVGEAAIGRVYAVNTLGAIVGVVLAVQLLMPWLGLKALIMAGGLVDVALGIWLLWVDRAVVSPARRWGFAGASLAYVLLVAVFVPLDTHKMASGVFRDGRLLEANDSVVYHHDGKTATVDVVKHPYSMSIRTNGKADAGVATDPTKVTSDEGTMILLAALPLMTKPGVKTIAVIGMGSGMSTHTALMMPTVDSVETVEIEPGMVEGAKLFGKKVANTFNDPRSQIHIDDAKTFFTKHQKSYDLIMSEPSNPWVSGVAGLFSVEFYRLVSRHLNQGGMFAQWFHIYESEPELVASVAMALSSVFPHYKLYGTGPGDLLFLASFDPLPAPDIHNVSSSSMRAAMAAIGMGDQADVDWSYIGSSELLLPFFSSYGVPANSDFYPYLDQHAVKPRFMNASASPIQMLAALGMARIDPQRVNAAGPISANHPLQPGHVAFRAQQLLQYWQSLDNGQPLTDGHWPASIATLVQAARLPLHECDELAAQSMWLPAMIELVGEVAPFWQRDDLVAALTVVNNNPCMAAWPAVYHQWMNLLMAIATDDYATTVRLVNRLHPAPNTFNSSPAHKFLLQRLLIARILTHDFAGAQKDWMRYEDRFDPPEHLRALSSYALYQQLSAH